MQISLKLKTEEIFFRIEIEGTWQQNAVWNPGPEKGHYLGSDEIWIRFIDSLVTLYQC